MTAPLLVPIPPPKLSKPQQRAMVWLRAHNGGGFIDQRGRLVAGGEIAPYSATIWLRLISLHLVGALQLHRIGLTPRGEAVAIEMAHKKVREKVVATIREMM